MGDGTIGEGVEKSLKAIYDHSTITTDCLVLPRQVIKSWLEFVHCLLSTLAGSFLLLTRSEGEGRERETERARPVNGSSRAMCYSRIT